MDMHAPDKTKQEKLLTEHLARQRTLPSTEEELQQHLERNAKREADRLLAAAEAETTKRERARQTKAARQARNANVIAKFAKQAKDAAIAARAATKEAETTRKAAAVGVETTFADSIAMQE